MSGAVEEYVDCSAAVVRNTSVRWMRVKWEFGMLNQALLVLPTLYYRINTETGGAFSNNTIFLLYSNYPPFCRIYCFIVPPLFIFIGFPLRSVPSLRNNSVCGSVLLCNCFLSVFVAYFQKLLSLPIILSGPTPLGLCLFCFLYHTTLVLVMCTSLAVSVTRSVNFFDINLH